WKAGLRWKGRWRNIRHAMRWAVFHALLTGRAFAYCRSRSNSGTIDRSACTTASCSAEPQTGDGRKQGSTPKAWAIPPFGTTPGDGSAGLPPVHEGHERGACFVGFQTLAEQFAFLPNSVEQWFTGAAYQVSRNPERLRGLLRHGVGSGKYCGFQLAFLDHGMDQPRRHGLLGRKAFAQRQERKSFLTPKDKRREEA